jgi:hypothetical protein
MKRYKMYIGWQVPMRQKSMWGQRCELKKYFFKKWHCWTQTIQEKCRLCEKKYENRRKW